VGGERLTWTAGEALLFDDSFEHSAAYRLRPGAVGSPLPPPRLVLVVDLWHPLLPVPDRAALGVLYPPGM